MKVYSMAAGFENCDAFVSIIGTTEDMVQEALDASIKEACERYESEDESADDVADTIWTVGPFVEDTDDPDLFDLKPAQIQELVGGFVVSFSDNGQGVGFTDVLATMDEAQVIAQGWKDEGHLNIEIRQVDPSVTYLDTP